MSAEEPIPEADAVDGAPHPRFTRNIYGQGTAISSFRDAQNSERLHHAWLLTGPRGVGKATLAWRIGKHLIAGGSQDDLSTMPDAPEIRRIEALSEPSLILARRPWDEKTKKHRRDITVTEIRRLRDFFTLSSAEGGWRVAIVDAVDDLNPNAANALLKNLEEPPEKTVFLLVCHQPATILPTIKSRCRTLRCGALSTDDLTSALRDAGHELGAEARAVSILANGSVGDALRIKADNGAALYAALLETAAQAPRMDRSAVLKLANACAGRGAESRYELTLHLIRTLLARLARFGALAPSVFDEATDHEAQTLSRLAPTQRAGRLWAEAEARITARALSARAVSLDPSSVILDMLLDFENTAQATAAA